MGLAKYEFKISTIDKEYTKNIKDFVAERERLLLSVTPKGTEIVEVLKHDDPIDYGLHSFYTLVLSHPWFKEGSKIELDTRRIASPNPYTVDHPHIEIETIVTAVRYVSADGKVLI